MYSRGPLHMDDQRQDVQLQPIYSSFMTIRDVALRIFRKQLTIRRCDERGSRISVLMARHDDDDDDDCTSGLTITPLGPPPYRRFLETSG